MRAALPQDAPAIAAIEALAASGPWSEAAVRSSLAAPTTRGFVVEEAGVVGHILATSVAGEGEVLTVAVHPEHRRQGHGLHLLQACGATWRAEGVTVAFLEVRADNTGAKALYVKQGWQEAGRRPHYYRDGTDALILRWEAR